MPTRVLLEGPAIEPLLAQVREEYGSGVRIISADKVRSGGFGGFFAKQHYELSVEVPDENDDRTDMARNRAAADPAPPTLEQLLARAEARDDISRPADDDTAAPERVQGRHAGMSDAAAAAGGMPPRSGLLSTSNAFAELMAGLDNANAAAAASAPMSRKPSPRPAPGPDSTDDTTEAGAVRPFKPSTATGSPVNGSSPKPLPPVPSLAELMGGMGLGDGDPLTAPFEPPPPPVRPLRSPAETYGVPATGTALQVVGGPATGKAPHGTNGRSAATPSDATPSDAPSSDAPSSGAPSSGAPSSGAPSSGAPSSGGPFSGSPAAISPAPVPAAPVPAAPVPSAPFPAAPFPAAPQSSAAQTATPPGPAAPVEAPDARAAEPLPAVPYLLDEPAFAAAPIFDTTSSSLERPTRSNGSTPQDTPTGPGSTDAADHSRPTDPAAAASPAADTPVAATPVAATPAAATPAAATPVAATPVAAELTPAEKLAALAKPLPVDPVVANLMRVGMPAELAVTITGGDTYAGVLTALASRPAAPAVPDGPGEILVLVGELPHALASARQCLEQIGLDQTHLLLAGPSAAGTGIHSSKVIPGPEDAARRTEKLHTADSAWVVAMDAPVGATDSAWVRETCEAIGATAVWAVVDATRKTSDTARHLKLLGEIEALVVYGVENTSDPATVLGLSYPIVSLDGRPATPHAWAAMLCARIATDVAPIPAPPVIRRLNRSR